jgi:hypothetical protein
VVPIHVDYTDYKELERIKSWKFDQTAVSHAEKKK